MTVLTEGTHAGEFIVSEEENNFCRDVITVASGQKLVAGQVLGKITASTKYVGHDPAASDGSQNPAAILFDEVDATGGDKKGVAIVRGPAQVNGQEIVWKANISTPNKTAAVAALAALGIIVRNPGSGSTSA